MTLVEYTDDSGTRLRAEFADAKPAFDFANTVLDAIVIYETIWESATRLVRESRKRI